MSWAVRARRYHRKQGPAVAAPAPVRSLRRGQIVPTYTCGPCGGEPYRFAEKDEVSGQCTETRAGAHEYAACPRHKLWICVTHTGVQADLEKDARVPTPRERLAWAIDSVARERTKPR